MKTDLCVRFFESRIRMLTAVGLAGWLAAPHGVELSVSALFDPAIAVIPDIHGDKVMYQDHNAGRYKFISRTITGTQNEVRDNGSAYMHPFDFGGTNLVWIDYKTTYGGVSKRRVDIPIPANGDYYVKVLALSSGSETHATSDVSYKECIATDGKWVSWTDYRHYSSSDTTIELYLYDASGGGEKRLTSHSGYKASLMVQGNAVVWQDYRNKGSIPSNADIYYATLPGGQATAICTQGAYQDHPCLYGDIIVWQDYRNAGGGSNADIYMYDRVKQKETAVCTNSAYQAYPKVYGDYVVWQDYRNAGNGDNADIYLYEISSGTEQAVTTANGYQGPPYIYGNNIVWYDYADGKVYRAQIGATTYAKPFLAAFTAIGNTDEWKRVYDVRGREVRTAHAKGVLLMSDRAGRLRRRMVNAGRGLRACD